MMTRPPLFISVFAGWVDQIRLLWPQHDNYGQGQQGYNYYRQNNHNILQPFNSNFQNLRSLRFVGYLQLMAIQLF